MKRLLYANGWIAIFFGVILTIGYYISFYDQIDRYPLSQQLLIALLVFFQIWGSVALVWVLGSIAQSLRYWIIILLIKIVVFGILLFMLADATTLFVLNMKFSVSEGLRLMSGGTQHEALISFDTMIIAIIVITVFFMLAYTLFLPKKIKKISQGLVLILVLSLIGAISTGSFLGNLSGPYLGSLLINPLLYNINAFIDQQLESKDTTVSHYPDYFISSKGLDTKRNIILIFAESFEPKYSLQNSGFHDYLPKFDALQRDGIQYNNFFTPGCVSENAHASLLQGIFPFSYGDTFAQGYQRFTGYIDTLPDFLNKEGYKTTFLSSVSLQFLDQYAFLKKMGFQTIVGDEVFRGVKDYVFLAAPDKPLYTKAISFIKDNLKFSQPFYLNMQTISTHKPWNTPYGKNEKNARTYADDQIEEFYKQLRQTSFFDNGILIIFGDHRVPMVLSSNEKEKLGPLWPTRVLATMIGKEIKPGSINDMIVQPIDVHFSLKHLIGSGDVTIWRDYNDIFDGTTQRDRGLYSCKYSNDTVSVVEDSGLSLLDLVPQHPAYGFVKAFKQYQQDNI